VNDRRRAVEHAGEVGRRGEVSAAHLHTRTHLVRHRGRVARHHAHSAAVGNQSADEGPTDEPGATQHEHFRAGGWRRGRNCGLRCGCFRIEPGRGGDAQTRSHHFCPKPSREARVEGTIAVGVERTDCPRDARAEQVPVAHHRGLRQDIPGKRSPGLAHRGTGRPRRPAIAVEVRRKVRRPVEQIRACFEVHGRGAGGSAHFHAMLVDPRPERHPHIHSGAAVVGANGPSAEELRSAGQVDGVECFSLNAVRRTRQVEDVSREVRADFEKDVGRVAEHPSAKRAAAERAELLRPRDGDVFDTAQPPGRNVSLHPLVRRGEKEVVPDREPAGGICQFVRIGSGNAERLFEVRGHAGGEQSAGRGGVGRRGKQNVNGVESASREHLIEGRVDASCAAPGRERTGPITALVAHRDHACPRHRAQSAGVPVGDVAGSEQADADRKRFHALPLYSMIRGGVRRARPT
jgi:hypothetical protein